MTTLVESWQIYRRDRGKFQRVGAANRRSGWVRITRTRTFFPKKVTSSCVRAETRLAPVLVVAKITINNCLQDEDREVTVPLPSLVKFYFRIAATSTSEQL